MNIGMTVTEFGFLLLVILLQVIVVMAVIVVVFKSVLFKPTDKTDGEQIQKLNRRMTNLENEIQILRHEID